MTQKGGTKRRETGLTTLSAFVIFLCISLGLSLPSRLTRAAGFTLVPRVLFRGNRSAISPCACALSAGSCPRIHTHLHCLLSQPLGKQTRASCCIIITICFGYCSDLLSLGSRDSIFSRSGGLGTAVMGETSRRVHLSGFFKGPLCHTSTLFSSLDLFMNMSIMVFLTLRPVNIILHDRPRHYIMPFKNITSWFDFT